MKEADYALGYTDAELRRLTSQARLIDPITRRFLEAAGLKLGMRVLDIGSGAGDVALLCAQLVGDMGEVVGTDLSQAAVSLATERARQVGARQISFRHGNPADMVFDRPFDAVVGRYVLQFLPDATDFLKQISKHVRPGGIIVFHELDWDGARSSPLCPTYDAACKLMSGTIAASGAQVRLGSKLAALFRNAGLPHPNMRLEAVIGSGPTAADVAHLVADLVETQLPTAERLGIATAQEVDHPTLVARILKEAGGDGTLIGRSEIGAWTVKTD